MNANNVSKKSATGVVFAAAALLLAAVSVLSLVLQPLEPAKAPRIESVNTADRYLQEMDRAFTKIVFGEVPEEKQIYTIPDTALAAPVPDPLCFGEADSPAELQWLVDQAQPLLEGQTLFFSTDIEILPGSKVYYYMDETILAITWKQVVDRAAFTYSEVKLMHPSQFRRYLSGGEFGSGILVKTTEMSASVNAVTAYSADFYAYRRKGVTVTNGTVHKSVQGVRDMCFIDYNGDMILERDLEFADAAEAQAYMDQHNINFSLCFGPSLIQDGEMVCPNGYNLGEVKKEFPRSAICQMDRLHYLYVASNIEAPYYNTMTVKEFAEKVYETGCRHAYTLDGGQTTTVVMNNQLINNVNYGSERLISDIIYFATAMPEGK